tara:strand:- start:511 stop:762 length:252 start_codon:yes stop_codon:yes gene_type:complete
MEALNMLNLLSVQPSTPDAPFGFKTACYAVACHLSDNCHSTIGMLPEYPHEDESQYRQGMWILRGLSGRLLAKVTDNKEVEIW